MYPEGEADDTFGHDVLSSIATRDLSEGVERSSWIRVSIGCSSSAVEAVMLIMKGFEFLGESERLRMSLTHPIYVDRG